MGYAEAIEQQMRALRFWRGEGGLIGGGEMVKAYGLQPTGDGEDLRQIFVRRLEAAEPFFVAASICDLLVDAARDLPTYPLREEALPTLRGWVYFEKPLPLGDAAPLRALNWSLDFDPTHRNLLGLMLGVFIEDRTGRFGCPLGVAIEAWMVGDSWDYRRDEGGARSPILAYFACFLAFIQQRLLVATTKPVLNRHARRRLLRERPEEPRVRVVQLRARAYQPREVGEHDPVGWSCQWPVRPHWHMYHTRDGLQPRFVGWYIKGPPNKPLRIPGATAYEVVR